MDYHAFCYNVQTALHEWNLEEEIDYRSICRHVFVELAQHIMPI
jgi:hypothetical protein